MIFADFGVLSLFRNTGHAEVNNGLKLVEDSGYSSQTAKIEAMLASGMISPIDDSFFDETEYKEVFDVPSDAEVRSYDADHTNIGQYVDGLRFNETTEVNESSGVDLHDVESTEKSVPVVEAEK